MAMRWLLFLLMIPIIFAVKKVEVKNIELKILNGPKNGAAYLSIYNGNKYAVTLYKVEVEPNVFERIELHDHVPRKDENGTEYMEMIEIPEMEISPGSTLFLQRGGKHLMLMGIKPILCKQKNLKFKLFFKNRQKEFKRIIKVDLPKGPRCNG